MISLGITIALIILAAAAFKHLTCGTQNSIPGNAEQRLTGRIRRLEKRLTDIQEIMISIDEQLDRERMLH